MTLSSLIVNKLAVAVEVRAIARRHDGGPFSLSPLLADRLIFSVVFANKGFVARDRPDGLQSWPSYPLAHRF
jgi:hypothetical protein